MANTSTRAIGNRGEDIAVAFLESKGFTILERNYTFERSEIDIIAQDDGTIVFVEVKLRRSTHFGRPEEFVDDKKIQYIYRAAEGWMYERCIQQVPVRFDVIAIIDTKNDQPQINHLIDAFR